MREDENFKQGSLAIAGSIGRWSVVSRKSYSEWAEIRIGEWLPVVKAFRFGYWLLSSATRDQNHD